MARPEGVRFVFGRRTTPREMWLKEGDYIQVEATPPGSFSMPLGAIYRVSVVNKYVARFYPLRGDPTRLRELSSAEYNILFKRWVPTDIKLSDYE